MTMLQGSILQLLQLLQLLEPPRQDNHPETQQCHQEKLQTMPGPVSGYSSPVRCDVMWCDMYYQVRNILNIYINQQDARKLWSLCAANAHIFCLHNHNLLELGLSVVVYKFRDVWRAEFYLEIVRSGLMDLDYWRCSRLRYFVIITVLFHDLINVA